MGHPVVFFEILHPNAKQLSGFYRQVFGWTINDDNPMNYGLIDTGGGDGAIRGGISDIAGDHRHVTFYVGVPDVRAALNDVEAAGGKTLREPDTMPDGTTIALFSDPEGNVIGMVKPGSGVPA